MACPIGDTGWQLAVEAYYRTGGRRYGELAYGDALYGDVVGSGELAWQEVTEQATQIAFIRGDQDGAIGPPISELALIFRDPLAELFDFSYPASFYNPDVGAPVRIVVIDPADVRYTLTTQVLARVLDQHGAGFRLIEVEAFDVLSQFAQPFLSWSAPAEGVGARLERVRTTLDVTVDIGFSVIEDSTIGLVADPVPTDPEEEFIALELLRLASSSAGLDLDSAADGSLRARRWPLPYTFPLDELVVVDCADDDPTSDLYGDPIVVTATEIGYVMDTDGMLNDAIAEHRDDPAKNARTTLAASVLNYSQRSTSLGWPLTGSVHNVQATAQGITDRAVARYGGLLKRPLYIDADIRVDPGWLPVLATLDLGSNLRVRRTGIAPLDHRCVVVGMEHNLDPPRSWTCRIYLSSIEQTVGTSPVVHPARWDYTTWDHPDDRWF